MPYLLLAAKLCASKLVRQQAYAPASLCPPSMTACAFTNSSISHTRCANNVTVLVALRAWAAKRCSRRLVIVFLALVILVILLGVIALIVFLCIVLVRHFLLLWQ